jgi:hypothetical protein
MVVLFLSIGKISSQVFKENYLGRDFEKYHGALFKIDEKTIVGFSNKFYNNFNEAKESYSFKVAYPEDGYKPTTIKDSLLNKIYIVDSILDKNGKTFNEKEASILDMPIFVLKDTLTYQKIYYKYDKDFKHNFPFLVFMPADTVKSGNISINVCDLIERRVDDFTDEVTMNSPLLQGTDISKMIIYKTISKNTVLYNLGLETNGITYNIGSKGVIILFEDGTKLNKPNEEIDVDISTYTYKYSAFITLNDSELKTLMTKKIKKYRLYIFDQEIDSSESEAFTKYVKCISEKK